MADVVTSQAQHLLQDLHHLVRVVPEGVLQQGQSESLLRPVACDVAVDGGGDQVERRLFGTGLITLRPARVGVDAFLYPPLDKLAALPSAPFFEPCANPFAGGPQQGRQGCRHLT